MRHMVTCPPRSLVPNKMRVRGMATLAVLGVLRPRQRVAPMNRIHSRQGKRFTPWIAATALGLLTSPGCKPVSPFAFGKAA